MTPWADQAWGWLKERPGALLALVAVLLYARTVGYEHALDDLAVIQENVFVKQGLGGIGDVLTHDYWAGFTANAAAYYRPLSLVTFCLEYALTGGAPWLGHLDNTLLYGLTAWLAWRLLRGFTSAPVAFSSVLLWVVHPVHVEVVANIKSRDELMGMALGLGALLAARGGRPLATAALLFLALLAKESSITLLAVIPALLWWTTDRGAKGIAGVTAAALGAAAAFWACRYAALGTLGIEHPENMLHVTQNALLGASSTGEHMGSVLAMVTRYAEMLVWPRNLSFDYSIGQVPLVGLAHPLAVMGGTLVLAVAVAIALNRRRGQVVGFALFSTAATLSVASNVVVLVLGSTLGERYLYAPSLFVALLVGLGIGQLGRWRLALFALALPLGVRTLDRTPDWRDNTTLIEADMAANPGNPRIASHYAVVRTEELRPHPKSVALLSQTVALHEQDPDRYHWAGAHAHTALGDIYRAEGMLPEAQKHYEQAVHIEPPHFQAWFNLGWVLYEQGLVEESTWAYGTGLRFKADHPLRDTDPTGWQHWWLNLCISAREAQQMDLARRSCQNAVVAAPNWGMAHAALGLVEQADGNPVEAEALFRKARALDPSL